MASAAGGGGRNSVRRRLFLLVAANLVVVLAVGVVGIAVTVRSHRSVHYLTEKVEPAGQANAAALQSLTDTETYVWGYGISGDPGLLIKYRAAAGRFEGRQEALRNARALDAQLALLIDDFLLAADNWFKAYAEPRVAGTVGPGTFEESRFDRGLKLFEEVRVTNTAVAARLDAMSAQAEQDAENLSDDIAAILAVVMLVAGIMSLLIGRRIGRGVAEPLSALEQTAHELAVGRHDARAPVTGPREVVQVATAINKMADENDRARAVEARVVEQLRALDSVKSDFVSNVSHELRTPLTSILGYLELLEEEMREQHGTPPAEMVAAAKRNVVRLGELIDDLLALTRSEAQRTELAPLDLGLLVHDIVTDMRVASSQQGVDIRLGLPVDPVPVLADGGQMARVVTNLVSNAVKFSQGESEVVVTLVIGDGEAVLAVEDHGIGIPESELDQLGSRFYRASNAVDMGITGTGLGLRIVQAIVENHHGSVDLRSTQGVGTTVWVRIPLSPTGTAEAESASERDAADRAARATTSAVPTPLDPAQSAGQVG
jgi:two-component system, OmpR family, sensor kinase